MMKMNVIKIQLLADITFSVEKSKTDTNIKTQNEMTHIDIGNNLCAHSIHKGK